MSISRAEVNRNYHGRVTYGNGNSAEYVVAHGLRQAQRAKRPSVSYRDMTNPALALEAARKDMKARHEPLERDSQVIIGRVVALPDSGDVSLRNGLNSKTLQAAMLGSALVDEEVAVGMLLVPAGKLAEGHPVYEQYQSTPGITIIT